jgi:hypothetical protein
MKIFLTKISRSKSKIVPQYKATFATIIHSYLEQKKSFHHEGRRKTPGPEKSFVSNPQRLRSIFSFWNTLASLPNEIWSFSFERQWDR